jgi:hypothetical protein
MQESEQEETAVSEDFQNRKPMQQLNRSVSQLCRSANSGWLLAIAGSAVFIAVGFLIARVYQAENQTRTEKFIHQLQNWIEHNRASVPDSLRRRLEAPSSFLGSLQQKKPVEKLLGQFKPKSFWSIFS